MTYNVFGGTLSLTQSINHRHLYQYSINLRRNYTATQTATVVENRRQNTEFFDPV